MAQQLVATGSSFDVNIYPYFAINDVNNLNFVLGNEGNTVDGVTYSCLLDQQVPGAMPSSTLGLAEPVTHIRSTIAMSR